MDVREKTLNEKWLIDTPDLISYIDEIATQFLSAKMALDRLAELLADDTNTAEILTEMKTRLEIIENGSAR